ncbi:hypothetical protein J4463_01225 [Candidatus Pacearchaeota archaeon]|nr:hypothetical protein [Candidatus Pacearchaeota archaeon]
MKKNWAFILSVVLFALFFSFSASVQALEDIKINPDDPLGIGINSDNLNSGDLVGSASDKWQYLQQEWTKILMQNPAVVGIDTFFKQFNIVFVILFAEQYAMLSPVLWLVVVLWILIAAGTSDLIRGQFGMDFVISFLLGVITTVIFAQMKIFRFFAELMLKVAFTPELWYVRLIVWLIIFAVVFAIFQGFKILSKHLKESRLAKAEKETAHRQKELKTYTDAAKKDKA